MRTLAIRTTVLAVMAAFLASVAGAQSLGEIARKLKAERAKEGEKPAKVFTNDNIPHAPSIQPSPAQSPGPEGSQARSSNPAISLAEKAAQTGASQASTTNTAEEHAAGESAESKMKTRDYWQSRFKQAREALSLAKEHQQLDENELNLLELQRARELDPNKAADLDSQITAKKSDVASRQSDTAAAQSALDELEKEFKDSGAPADWSENQ